MLGSVATPPTNNINEASLGMIIENMLRCSVLEMESLYTGTKDERPVYVKGMGCTFFNPSLRRAKHQLSS
ncbi:hypothetical protein NDU88_008262 [Pleurodeles waltl]|uniref:Uncharacterized protein n=1 Tax=Pleurodeles waltl TaxID=8319 RepID=A0AAV7NXD7_PLEWA|nr:hypothetical protein NDU88_008262 [Pleurodeles waltl]